MPQLCRNCEQAAIKWLEKVRNSIFFSTFGCFNIMKYEQPVVFDNNSDI